MATIHSFEPLPCDACTQAQCGRYSLNNSDFTCEMECKACPWGWYVNSSSSFCQPCNLPASLRDYLFIVFPVVLSVACNWLVLSLDTFLHPGRVKSWLQSVFSVVILLESILSFLLVFVLFPPTGQFSLNACGVEGPLAFYPMFWRSSETDSTGVSAWQCVSEAVFPRLTLVLSYLGLSVVVVLLVRLPLTLFCWHRHPHNASLCFGLIIAPALAALFVATSGLLFYSFEYISLGIGSVVLAVESVVTQWKMNALNPCRVFLSPVHWMTVGVCILFFAFGMVGLDFYPYHYTLIPLFIVPVTLHPLFTWCTYSHPYTRLWRLRKRQRKADSNAIQIRPHRWLRGERAVVQRHRLWPNLDTNDSTSDTSSDYS